MGTRSLLRVMSGLSVAPSQSQLEEQKLQHMQSMQRHGMVAEQPNWRQTLPSGLSAENSSKI